MHLKKSPRLSFAGVVCLGLSAIPLRALVSLNDGRDKVFVSGQVTYAWDSNVMASSDSRSDYTTSVTLTAEYSRRAGLIGVDSRLSLNMTRFGSYTAENFSNPQMSLEFTKQTGRTTGSLVLSAARESRADTAANIRNQSWNYSAALSLRYPVIDRYSLSGGVGVSKRDYVDNQYMVDQTALTANADLFYVYTSERDLFGGYRYRHENSALNTHNTDHAFSLGVSGRILPKLNGSIRAGYQVRQSDGAIRETFDSWMASVSTTWNISKRLTATGTISKDFSTTSTNLSTDTFAASWQANYNYSAKWALGANAGVGHSRFLGVMGGNREDTYYTYGFDVSYSMNDHFKAILSYTHLQNWSTASIADFIRNAYSIQISSRW